MKKRAFHQLDQDDLQILFDQNPVDEYEIEIFNKFMKPLRDRNIDKKLDLNYDLERFRMFLLMAQPFAKEQGISSFWFSFDGSSDSKDSVEGGVIVENVEKMLVDDYRQIKLDWSYFIDFVATKVEEIYGPDGYEIDMGGGGTADWDINTGEFSVESFYRTIVKVEEGSESFNLNEIEDSYAESEAG